MCHHPVCPSTDTIVFLPPKYVKNYFDFFLAYPLRIGVWWRQMPLTKEARKYFAKEGRKGGKARAAKLTKQQRREIAQKAIAARWAKAKKKKPA